jgi:tetratricopeptide (TPR) repeat protein
MTAEEQAKKEEQAHMEKRFLEYGDAINASDHARAETIMLEIFEKIALQAMTEEPTQRRTWELLKSECEDQGNWIGAEEAQRKVLELALEEPNPLLSVKPHLDLAGLCRLNGKYEEASAEIEKALSKARASDILHLSLMALEAKGRLLIEMQSFEEADKILREALASIPAGFNPHAEIWRMWRPAFTRRGATCKMLWNCPKKQCVIARIFASNRTPPAGLTVIASRKHLSSMRNT